jgi:NDP-sugar pyrophosphorylase family protein
MKVRWSIEQPDVLGTGGALRKIEAELCGGGPFLLMNGDTVVGADLPALLAAHRAFRAEHGTVATLFCMPRPDAATYGAVRVAKDGRIVDLAGLGRTPGASDADVEAAAPTVFCGIHVIEPEVVASLPPHGFSGIVRQGYAPLIAAGADVRAVLSPPDTVFHDVGTPSRYLDAQAALLEAPPFLPTAEGVDPREALFQEASYAVDASGREYGSPDSVTGLARATLRPPFFFGPRNEVGAGAIVGPNASLGALNTVGAGAKVEDAALWSQVEVLPGEALTGVLAARLGGERTVVDGRPA